MTALGPADQGPAAGRAPRVLVAHDYLTQRGGAERVALAILEAFPGARMLTTMYAPETTFPEFADHDVETMWPNRFKVLRADPRRAFPILAPTVAAHRVSDVDVVVASSSGWMHGIGRQVPTIVYCHNPARWLYQPEDYARDIPAYGRAVLKVATPALRRWDAAAASRAALYLANSTVVQRRIGDAYGIEARLLFPPAGLTADGPQWPVDGVEPGFLVTVARARGYKNTHSVCEAVASAPGTRLVVVGASQESLDRFPRRIQGVTGVSDEQLRWLYANARGLVAVSHEDFGLTPVEGYGFGLPSVLLRAGGYLDSSLEGLTTVFVDEESPRAIRVAIAELMARTWDREAIRQHGTAFSKSAFQQRLQSMVAEVVGRRGPQATAGTALGGAK